MAKNRDSDTRLPMYGHSQIDMHRQIVDDDCDGAGCGGESIDNSIGVYEERTLEDGGVVIIDNGEDMGEDVLPDAVYGTGDASVNGSDDLNQLSISFRGQVFVFRDVTPEKVQSVLLMLGGAEMPFDPRSVGMVSQKVDCPLRSSKSLRAASLDRFRKKKNRRCYEKIIRYDIRREVALRMQRKKGQFSGKTSEGDSGNGNNNNIPDSGQDVSSQEILCRHCGISSNNTPMMRRGPDGPRTLCNACGLFWASKGTLRASKGTLRELVTSKGSEDQSTTPTPTRARRRSRQNQTSTRQQGDGEAENATVNVHTNIVADSFGEYKPMIVD